MRLTARRSLLKVTLSPCHPKLAADRARGVRNFRQPEADPGAKLGDVQDLSELLSFVALNVDGAQCVALGGSDGLLVEQYPDQQSAGQPLSAFTAEMTNVLSALARLDATGLGGGRVKEVMVTADKAIHYTRRLNADFFLVVIMSPAGNLGKVRLYTEQVAPKMLELF